MAKAVLRMPGSWAVISKQDAQNLGLSVESLAPTHTADDVGLILDRSDWVEMSVDRWVVAYRVVDQRGQPVISELRIFPQEKAAAHKRPPGQWSGMYGSAVRVPPGGITARLLRSIKTQAFREVLRQILARHVEALTAIAHPLVSTASVSPGSKRGRKGRTDRELARIAAAYETAYIGGHPATRAVAKAFALSFSQARDAVHRARVRGLLSPAGKQGKGGGTLTPIGRALLRQSKKRGTRHGAKR